MAGGLIEIPYELVSEPSADLREYIVKGFGPDGLGAVTVSGVPGYGELRQRLLPLAERFAELPTAVREQHEDPSSSYNIGWSHGKECLAQGQLDTRKGSFYANPCQDTYVANQGLVDKYPSYYRPNIWPQAHLPELEPAFKELGQLMISVGLQLVQHCARYLECQGQRLGVDPQQLRASHCHKGRLLHYFPPAGDDTSSSSDGGASGSSAPQDWCGWHLDHGAITGLTCAMYLKGHQEVPCPDPEAGLYIRNRGGAIVRATIPPSHLAFQLGQVMSIASGGLLRATPHCVRAAAPEKSIGVSRNTFAVFMQPEVTQPLARPPGTEALSELLSQDSGTWQDGMSFGDFAERTMTGYYHSSRAAAKGLDPAAALAVDVGAPAAALAAAAAAAAGDGAGAHGPAVPFTVYVVHE